MGVAQALNPDAIALYLVFGYVPSPFAIWSGVEKLPPGHTMLWRARQGVIQTRCYWSPPDQSAERTPDVEEMESLIDAAVDAHLLSNVPLGVFLSGGLDSSLVASSAARLNPDTTLSAVSIGFPGSQDDEAGVAEETAGIIGLDWEKLDLSGELAEQHHNAAFAALDEPYSFSAIVTQNAVSSLAAQRNKVMLSGDGGDEVFGGYRWYQNLDADPKHAKTSLGGLMSPKQKLQRFAARSPRHRNVRRISGAFAPENVADLVAGISASRVAGLVDSLIDQCDAPGLPLKRRLQRLDLMTFCADCICYKVDRSGMDYSLEVRPPLLDHTIIEKALAAPLDPTFDAEPKAIVRQILARRGLGHLLSQPKRGFSLKLSETRSKMRHGPGHSALTRNVTTWQQRKRGITVGQRRALDYLECWLDGVHGGAT